MTIYVTITISDCILFTLKYFFLTEVTTVDVEKPKSLRHSEDTAEQSSLLNVAPEVQKFIAKHLSRICDK